MAGGFSSGQQGNSTSNVAESIPVGSCQCGCGGITAFAKFSTNGYRKGDRLRFIHGHNKRKGMVWEAALRGMVICWKCNRELTKDSFNPSNIKAGKAGECKSCSRQSQAKLRVKNKDRYENYARKFACARYGMTQQQYTDMFHAQNGQCALCCKKETVKMSNGKVRSLAIDHDHETGKVRGLLCHHCNIGLGAFRDNQEVLAKAISYLQGTSNGSL